MSFHDLPIDIQEKIFLHLNYSDIGRSRLVCQRWYELLRDSNERFWWKKALLTLSEPQKKLKLNELHNWVRVSKLRANSKNLIKNSRAKENLRHWVSRGDFKVEKPPSGSSKVPLRVDNPAAGSENVAVWATSFMNCSKYQLVELQRAVDADILDTCKPPIHVSELHASRADCGCAYELKVDLLGFQDSDESGFLRRSAPRGRKSQAKFSVWSWLRSTVRATESAESDTDSDWDESEVLRVLQHTRVLESFAFTYSTEQWKGGVWRRVEHTFRDYPAGVRLLRFAHTGKDTQYWAGHYGAKFTKSTVLVGCNAL